LSVFGIVSLPKCLLAPLVGFITGLMFSTLAMLVTSFVRTINHFNFYFTGFISPMFFFSGVVFPISNLPAYVRPIAEIVPLTHSVRLVRAVCTHRYNPALLLDLLYIVVFILIIGFFAIRRLRRRLVY
jgi:lipooligosaccharide transport system permease protein